MKGRGLRGEDGNVRSEESLLRPDGGLAMPWQFSYNRLQRSTAPSDLLGNLTVHLSATVLLNYRIQPKEAPKEDKP